MRELLAALGEPQAGFPAVHVVGTNGKSTTTRMIEELLLAHGLRAGAYRLAARSRVERARSASTAPRPTSTGRCASSGPPAERLGATQFEALTAAAFVAYRAGGVEAAAIEAGLGGRHDATNVLDGARVVVLTNVSLDHTEVLGETREAIATEKLAVVRSGCTVVLGEPEWEDAARAAGAGKVVVEPGSAVEVAVAAAREFLGADVDGRVLAGVTLPGRLERRPGEIRDGAHNPGGVRWLVDHLPPGDYTVMASILADKDVDEMLEVLATAGSRFVACTSSNPRALPAAELASKAASRTSLRVETVADPRDALVVAHELGAPVLVTGSLYLLGDLENGS